MSCAGGVVQLVAERGQLVDLALGLGELLGDEVVEALLHGTAALAVPDADEVGDVLERAAELLGPGDERQPGERPVVVEPVAGVGAGRWAPPARCPRSTGASRR